MVGNIKYKTITYISKEWWVDFGDAVAVKPHLQLEGFIRS